MKITNKIGKYKLRHYNRLWEFKLKPGKLVIHHTVSPTASGTANYLQTTPYAYHYMIEKSGEVLNYVDPGKYATNHAKGANRGTIGIAFVCGGKYGPVNAEQFDALKRLILFLKREYPSLKIITGHRNISPRRKVDPTWPGESAGNALRIHHDNMQRLIDETGVDLKYGK